MKMVWLTFLLCAVCWAQDVMPGIQLSSIGESGTQNHEKEMVPPQGVESSEERLIRCKRPLCDMMCAYGYAIGEDGCPICKCKTPEDLCHEFGDCPNGHKCRVPTCFGEACATVKPQCIPECAMLDCLPCPGGVYRKDERGCQTCECEAMPCPMPMCSDPCENGYASDENGCMTCNCNHEPQQQREMNPGQVEGENEEPCPKFSCRMFCSHGFEKDERGCQMCKCRRQPEHCLLGMCRMLCQFGFEKDEQGCDICRCRQHPVPCPMRMCRMMMNCPNGFEKDAYGCETCMCKRAELEDICRDVKCPAGLSCKAVTPSYCMGEMCNPLPVCRPPSLCELHHGPMMSEDEIEMMLHHLGLAEQEKLFPGPPRCQPDGSFEPKQCFSGKCFCVDDRSVMWSMTEAPECRTNMTVEMMMSFQLEHDIATNELESSLRDVEELVKDAIGEWMAIKKDLVVMVEVEYSQPGILLVQSTVINDGLSDLMSASHYMHRQMREGRCNLNYKQHILKPEHDTIKFEHHYETTLEPGAANHLCWGHVCYNRPMFGFCAMGIMLFIGLMAVIPLVVWKRKRMMSYQFRHKKMEDDNFKKNIVFGSELDIPRPLDSDVKVTLVNNLAKPDA